MININWETRAKERRIENKRLKKKIKELTTSRDGWKDRATERKENLDELNKKMATVKKNLQQIMGL
jgi:t-SNARE complex subunit (syntaxin)